MECLRGLEGPKPMKKQLVIRVRSLEFRGSCAGHARSERADLAAARRGDEEEQRSIVDGGDGDSAFKTPSPQPYRLHWQSSKCRLGNLRLGCSGTSGAGGQSPSTMRLGGPQRFRLDL